MELTELKGYEWKVTDMRDVNGKYQSLGDENRR